ncbi:Protein CBG10190 [Caenorhabditis briggsae]|uniref:Protein CBG10190 n=1 Tax=Caenorhabditis briggsae TaxID=6238 RepID=A8XAV5_CAEBR|nr:Protein CBG10190 [Caenorhabditis briggsae]CAP29770.2 Protein CBG10190 [Caenorhabditis briggsae]
MSSSGAPGPVDDGFTGTSRATDEMPEVRNQTNRDSLSGFFSLSSAETSCETVALKKHQLIIDTKDENTTHSWVHCSNISVYLSMSFNAEGELNISANRFKHENISNALTGLIKKLFRVRLIVFLGNLFLKEQDVWNASIKEKLSSSELFLSISGGFNHSLTHFLKPIHLGVSVPLITISLIGQNLCILFNGSGTLDSLTFPTKTTFVVPSNTDPLVIKLKIKPSLFPVNFMGSPACSVPKEVTPTTSSNSGSTGNSDNSSSPTNEESSGRLQSLNQNSTSSPDANAFKNPSVDSRTSSHVTLAPHTGELLAEGQIEDEGEEEIDVVNETPARSPVPSPDVSSVEEQVKIQKPRMDDLQGDRDSAGFAPQINLKKSEEPARKAVNPGELTSHPEQSPSRLIQNEDMTKVLLALVQQRNQAVDQKKPVKDAHNPEKLLLPSNLQQIKEQVEKKEIAVIVQKRADRQEEPERRVAAHESLKTKTVSSQKEGLPHSRNFDKKKKLAQTPDSDEESEEDERGSSSRKRWSSSSSDSLYEKTENSEKKPPVVDATSSEEDHHSKEDNEDRSNWCPSFNPNCLIGNGTTDDLWMECDTCHKWWHAFCIRLEIKAYKNAFHCCHGEYSKKAQDSLEGTTKKKWLQIQKEQARKNKLLD